MQTVALCVGGLRLLVSAEVPYQSNHRSHAPLCLYRVTLC